MAEHLQLSHPLVCTITMLFKLVIKLNYVPNSFGLGKTIPIPKGNKNRVFIFNKLEDFRGITISCILSKVFEFCLNKCLEKYLVSTV